MDAATPDMMTPSELAARLGLTPKTLANQRACPDCRVDENPADGEPPRSRNCARHPFVWVKVTGEIGKPGGSVRYPRQLVESVIDARTRGGVAA
jgi:hypothetical protein